MQMGSLNIDHEYQKPTEKLNTLLLNTLEAIIIWNNRLGDKRRVASNTKAIS